MDMVVVLEEFGSERSGIFEGAELLGERRAVFEDLEGCF